MRRFRFGSPRGWATGFGIAAASLVGGALIARETVGAMDPFYRYPAQVEWREPRARVERTEPAPVAFAPIGWADEVAPPPPIADAYDDAPLLGAEERAPEAHLEFEGPVAYEWTGEAPGASSPARLKDLEEPPIELAAERLYGSRPEEADTPMTPTIAATD